MQQHWNVGRYKEPAIFTPALATPVRELLARPSAGEAIPDLGCGEGILTRKLVAGTATVVGAHASPKWSRSADDSQNYAC
jgi:trans-aconitate methyltransferase